uniref:Reverse transcriptase domain-containing protein n=1 Tax=Tanacetum cinerariifolium TaxID=118510 RepID=A0A6L2K961_TANCI|nr:reverse transcriptase domain-containing protein [Tanacetum cinerariifolium]
MRTRSSSNLPVVSSNPSTLNPKRRNRRRLKQPFILEESPIDTMADQRTIAKLLRAPPEGYKDLLRAYPHHGFTEFHQLDTFYNALNPADQDSLNAAEGGNLLERRTQDVLTIIENKSKVRNSRNKSVVSQVKSCDSNSNSSSEIAKLTHAVNQQTSAVTTAMTAILKQFQATPPPASVKAVEETCVTCGGAHPITSVSPPVATLSQNFRIISKDTFQQPQLITIRVIPFIVLQLHINITLADALILMPKYQKMLKALFSNKEKLQELANIPLNENCLAVILKKLPEKLRDPGKFLIPCGFTDVVIVDYESDPRVPLILGRPFLQTARALIDVHGEEMILRDDDERLILNMSHDTSSYSNQPQKELVNLINVFNNSKVQNDIFDLEGGNVLLEKLLDLDSTKDRHSPPHVNSLSGSTTYYSSLNPLLEELANELALITFPPKYDDDLQFDGDNLANLADNFFDSMPEIFTDEHALDYSSPLIFDEYDDDFLEVESDYENVYDDPFDSKGEKIKESKLLIDELDLPCDFLLPTEYDSFISQDFSGLMLSPQPTTRTRYLTQVSSVKRTLLKSLLVLFKMRSWSHLMLLWCSRILILLSMNFLYSKKFPGLRCYSIFIRK